MPILAELYFNRNSTKQIHNAEMFVKITERFEWMNFKQPNKDKSPWHWQGYIPCVEGEDIVVQFWPHKGKAAREECKPVLGFEAICAMIAEAIDDSQEDKNLYNPDWTNPREEL